MDASHPLSPETAAWLDSLDQRSRLVARIAMQYIFRFLRDDADWAARIEAACAELRLTKTERQKVYTEAVREVSRIGRRG
jgi:hypothetical protein